MLARCFWTKLATCRSDFEVLTQRLLADCNPGRSVLVAPDLLARLNQYPWPGNLRQYANLLRTASAMLEAHGDRIDWQHLPDDLLEDLTAPAAKILLQNVGPSVASDSSQNLQQLSRLAIRQALESSSGNVSQAAWRLGISRQTLYRKLNP